MEQNTNTNRKPKEPKKNTTFTYRKMSTEIFNEVAIKIAYKAKNKLVNNMNTVNKIEDTQFNRIDQI